jgi:hypothetical protein
VLDAGRVDDARRVVETVAVEARGGLVQGLVVEDGGQSALLEVTADDRHRRNRRGRRDAQTTQRRDQPAPRGVAERKLVDRGREDVRDLLRDQLLGRRHADVDRVREAADGEARLLAESRVRLVGDHEVIRVRVEILPVPREPGVGLHRQGRLFPRARPLEDRVLEAVAVALRLQLAVELGDEQAAVGEDQDADRAGRLDEAGGRDRLAGRGRVAEPVAAVRTRVLALVLLGELELLRPLLEVDAEILLFLLGLGDGLRGLTVAVPVLLRGLRRGDHLRQHPGQRVDLVATQLCARGEARLLF